MIDHDIRHKGPKIQKLRVLDPGWKTWSRPEQAPGPVHVPASLYLSPSLESSVAIYLVFFCALGWA